METALKQKALAIHKNSLGTIAGHLPKDLDHIGSWINDIVKKASLEKEKQNDFQFMPAVDKFYKMITSDSKLEAAVKLMLKQGVAIHQQYEPNVSYPVDNLETLMTSLNYIITHAPEFDQDVPHSAFPMSGLFVYMMATEAGWDVFRNETFNDGLRLVLQSWCEFLDSPQSLSVITTKSRGWLSPPSVIQNNLTQFVTNSQQMLDPKHWGFKSFNDFFHRQIIPICRPMDGIGNESVVVSSNDGTVYRLKRNVQDEADIDSKGQPYSLKQMLDGSKFTDDFMGGDVLQTFLSGHDYHRWTAPVSGKIIEQRIVNAFMFSELQSEGFDPSAGTESQGYEANVNTRGIVIIENDKIGKVCVMPIGITEISSISFENKLGDYVEKGQELGRFSYGGSSMCLIFEKDAIKQFTVVNPDKETDSDDGPFVRVKAQIAIANIKK
ncbi:phosphatidylserine decarboxylase family protein [Aureivirga sp. CE67]|uniref:phosphatidylserine decarboxylase family protein n=1 Tax=Aureivirga sp. CE67 TaxID=1788983 RepID=UPI0018CB6353|nr:phosphatidylserine decarboxylase family protein [Aureivirga sp. CE67]